MPELPEKPANNGVDTTPAPEPRRSLREVAEAAYDEVVEASGDDEAPETPEPSGQEGRARDKNGRFIAADQATEPGEAAAPKEPPSPETEPTPVTEPPHPAPKEGEAAQAPENWSAEDRANFEKLPPEGKAFLLKRHSEMEGDYQKRVQATAVSNQFVQAVAPVFNDPEIAESLRQDGRTPIEAVYQWAGFHKRALAPALEARVELLFELAQRMQIDPAAVFGLSATPVTGLSKEELANPAVKKIADQVGQAAARIQALEADIKRRTEAEAKSQVDHKRAEIDAFADQKNADGTPAHPYFDHFLPVIMEHFRTRPELSIQQCYDLAIKPVREGEEARVKAQLTKDNSVQRAQSAVRSNVRGMTAPVAKPPDDGKKRGLRTVIEDSADEVGF